MSTPFIGEIRMFGGNFAPQGWALCNGQLLAISENDALFTLIGTTYGGDGQSTFGLPNLQSRLPVHQGNGFVMGQTGGEESVTLTTNQIPAHAHAAAATTGGGDEATPKTGVWAAAPTKIYANGPANTPMRGTAVSPTGGSQPHDNMSPFVAVNFIISLFGVFPSQA